MHTADARSRTHRSTRSSKRLRRAAAVEEAPAEGEGPRGLARYRNAAMVGAGGLACAAVGAFLGGLGGYFTVNPAAAHSLAASTTPDQTLAGAADQAHGGETAVLDSVAVGSASLSSLSGSLTRGTAPLQWLVSSSGSGAGVPGAVTLADLPGGAASGLGAGTGTGSGLGSRERPRLGLLGYRERPRADLSPEHRHRGAGQPRYGDERPQRPAGGVGALADRCRR